MKKTARQSWQAHLVRVTATEPSAARVLASAQQRGDLPVQIDAAEPAAAPDYAQLDATLAIEQASSAAPPPASGLGYAGFTPGQRAAFLNWLPDPQAPAPPAFQQLYLANLEVRLLEPAPLPQLARERLWALGAAPAWARQPGLARATLLAFWLAQDGAGLANWLARAALPAELMGTALGQQALLGTPLTAAQLPAVLAAWSLPAALSAAVLTLRLDSLTATLGQDPLAYVLAKLGEDARRPLPWRCQHRDLRLSLPQPAVRYFLEALLVDMLAFSTAAPVAAEGDAVEPDAAEHGELDRAHLIIEFGHSRSEVFGYALRLAQKQAGFQQLMDETRHVVYRVPFRRNETRRFWSLWETVQNWSSTRIYCAGRELEKWQVYPYSQYLQGGNR